jgi:hypothetical protein
MQDKRPVSLHDFVGRVSSEEVILDSNDIFRELRKAQRLSDMVNNRSKEGRKPITETDLRLLQNCLNRQKKKLSHLGAFLRNYQKNRPGTQIYIGTLP